MPTPTGSMLRLPTPPAEGPILDPSAVPVGDRSNSRWTTWMECSTPTGSRIRICGQHRYPPLENPGHLGRPLWRSGLSPSVISVERRSEGEDPAVGSNQPIAAGSAVSGHADDRAVERGASHRAVEAGIAEGKDASVGCYEPVALSVGRGSHSIDRLVERNRPHGSKEGGSEGENPAVTRHFPIPASGVVDRDANDRLVEVLATH